MTAVIVYVTSLTTTITGKLIVQFAGSMELRTCVATRERRKIKKKPLFHPKKRRSGEPVVVPRSGARPEGCR